MRDLRLIGVHDDGEHLVVADSDGEEYRIEIDDRLRAAARRDKPRLGQLEIEIDSTVRPREVQAMIRAGATADEVAARTGWSLEKIARFEGPVLAEREHVAGSARRVRMRGQGAGANETLGGRAAARLAARSVAEEDVIWDSARDGDGQWTVTASFTAGGKERRATWWFDPAGMSVVAKNDEARWLSEADAQEGVVPTPHRPTTVFDVEAEEARSTQRDSDELMASMREHARGRRRGRRKVVHEPPLPIDEPESPAAPTTPTAIPTVAPVPDAHDELPPGAKGVHPRDEDPGSAPEAASEPADAEVSDVAAGPATDEPREASAEATEATEAVEAAVDAPTEPVEAPPVEEVPEPVEAAAPDDSAVPDEPGPADEPGADTPSPEPAPSPKPPKRKGRASVPSWDDVMFGKSRGDQG